MSRTFPANSRHAHAALRRYVAPDGREIEYVAARTIPAPERHAALAHHRLESAQRLDLLADRYYGDPEQYWRICDANGVFWPPAATRARTTLVIPLPLEVGGHGDA